MSEEDGLAELAAAYSLTPAELLLFQQSRREEMLRTTRDPAVLLPEIAATLRIRAVLQRVVKTNSTPPHYRLETDRGMVQLGPSSRWVSRPGEFESAFLDGIAEVPRRLPLDERGPLFEMIARAAEVEDIGEEATAAGWMRQMIDSYLYRRTVIDSAEEAVLAEYPFRDDAGCIVIFGRSLRQWIFIETSVRIGDTDFGKRMRLVGATPVKPNVVREGMRTQLSAWRLPQGWEAGPSE